MSVLIVKTSSLGDLIHLLPALTDAARARPELRFDWLAERNLAEIPRWHPTVDRVVECDLRGWRAQGRAAWQAWQQFSADLRLREYSLVIDAQGLLKSALLARRARGPLVGPGLRGAREPSAALFYRRRLAVPRHDRAHAIQRGRILFAGALDYPFPDTPPDAGLAGTFFPRPGLRNRYIMLLHGTTWPGKRWSLENWRALGVWLADRGITPVLPAGNDDERRDATAIAESCGGVVLPPSTLTELAGWLTYAQAAVGVDTGLAHLAAALGTPQLSLYGPTLPELTGAVGAHQRWLRTDPSATTIDRRRFNQVPLAAVQAALEEMLGRL